jgi:putative OPT family oligopeptide transporter
VAVVVAVALPLTTELGVLASLLVILGSWIAATMAAVLTGQTGVNPMEILGILVLLAVKALFPASATVLVSAAAVTAIAAGLAGDMMNDYRAGYLFGTRPRSQRTAETLGGLLGAVISAFVLLILVRAYGPESLGDPAIFPAPQAQAVAAMAGGIPHPWSFGVGAVLGALLFLLKVPVMTLGLGIYLPVAITAPVFIGGLVRFVVDRIRRGNDDRGYGTIIASGLLGGEAVTGVVLAVIRAAKDLIGKG